MLPTHKDFADLAVRVERAENALVGYKPTPMPTSPDTELKLNDAQQEAVDRALAGESFVLTGAAGTGKTFTVNTIARKLFQDGGLGMGTFRDPTGGVNAQTTKPNMAFVAYTNRATNNMYNNLEKLSPDLVPELGGCFMTIHKLIEYAPEYYVDENGDDKMRFVPRRDALNRLPIRTLIIEEASMVGLDLWHLLFDALEPNTQIILLGDINQLPPVFGDAILNYGLLQLPVVHLTHVYRQALDSPIIRQAHKLLNEGRVETDTDDFQVIAGKSNKPIGAEKLGRAASSLLEGLFLDGVYDPMQDIILSPFNKGGCGTTALNLYITSWLDEECRRQGNPRTVYEIKAAMLTHYYAVGDLVYDAGTKQTGVIKKIHSNGNYYGAVPKEASIHMNRFGIVDDADAEDDDFLAVDYSSLDINALGESEAESKIMAASHVITILLEDGREIELSSVGEVNSLALGYSLTCHKAQGCEWRKVFMVLHSSHTLANREWVYTAITRAKETCMIIARKDTLAKACLRQRIKGDSLQDKINAFNDKLKLTGNNNVTFVRT